MAALVADYSSSESEGEPESESDRGPGPEPEGNRPRAGKESARLHEPPLGESESEEESSDGGSQEETMGEPQDASALLRLPPPELEGGKGPAAGVFANPFAQERRQRLSLLEKHVRLTASVRPPEQAGGRKVCLAHRRDGRCRYGSNCKFAHDSDLPTSDPESPAGSQPQEENIGSEQEPPKKGKKRPGLSPTLIPPKRSLKNYRAQRAKEGLGLL